MDEMNEGKKEGDEGWIDEYTARSILAQAAERMVDKWYTKAIAYNDLYGEAEKYLLKHTSEMSFSYTSGGLVYEMDYFKASDEQKANHGLVWDDMTSSSWDFYDQLVSKAVDRENLPEYNDVTKHYFDLQNSQNPSRISRETLETLRAAGYTDEQIVKMNREMDAYIDNLFKEISGLDALDASQELIRRAEKETDPERKKFLQILANVGPFVVLTNWVPTGGVGSQAGKTVGKEVAQEVLEKGIHDVAKNIAGEAAELAVKNADKVIGNIPVINLGKINEISSLLNKTDSSNGITIGGKIFVPNPDTGNAKIFSGVTDNDIFEYFKELTGVSNMPVAREIQGKGLIYVVETQKGNITLRNFARSSDETGAKWTIDIAKEHTGTTYSPEIKFITE